MAIALIVAVNAGRTTTWTREHALFQGQRSGLTIEHILGQREYPTILKSPGDVPQAQMSSSPAKYTAGGSVQITATFPAGQYTPEPDDYVTVSCGPLNGANDYIDTVPVLDAAKGTNTVTVTYDWLPYMRCDYVFTYVATTYYPSVQHVSVGSVTVPYAGSPTDIHQVRLILDEASAAESSVRVMWTSTDASPGVVQVGSVTASSSSSTFNSSWLCHGPANMNRQQWFRDVGHHHTALVTGLPPATTLSYRIVHAGSVYTGSLHTPASPKATQQTVFVGIGDMDISPGAHMVTAGISAATARASQPAEFLVHFGDLGYGQGQGWVWERWMELVSTRIASKIPYMVSVGNHEMDYDINNGAAFNGMPATSFVPSWWNNGLRASAGECGIPTAMRWWPHADKPTQMWWRAYTYGLVRFISMSSEHSWMPGSDQYVWLQGELAAVDRTVTPWVVVTAHRMMYSTQECETGDYVVSLHMREALDALLVANKVNLVLVGHQHSYERICPVINGTCQASGAAPVHVTVGSAGAGLEGCGWSPALGAFTVATVDDFGWLEVVATRASMAGTFVRASNGQVADSFTLRPY